MSPRSNLMEVILHLISFLPRWVKVTAKIDSHLKWTYLVSLETHLCHVISFWKLSNERMFHCNRHLRGNMMFRTNIYIAPQTMRGCSCIALLCWSSLIFACHDFIEINMPNNFLWHSSCFLYNLVTILSQ